MFDEFGYTDKPTWIRFNVAEFIQHFQVQDTEDVMSLIEEDSELTEELGYLFWNMLLYSVDRNNRLFKPSSRETRLLFNIIKRGIDNSYARYEQCVENGKKGGRPKKDADEE